MEWTNERPSRDGLYLWRLSSLMSNISLRNVKIVDGRIVEIEADLMEFEIKPIGEWAGPLAAPTEVDG